MTLQSFGDLQHEDTLKFQEREPEKSLCKTLSEQMSLFETREVES